MSNIKRTATYSLITVVTLVSACFPVNECKNCSPPQEAIAEMRIHGVTWSTNTHPFPETISTNITSDARYTSNAPIVSLDSYDIQLVFSPPTERSTFFQPTGNEWDEHPYAYAFSKLTDGEYNLIKPLLPFNYSVAPTTDLNTRYGPIKIDNSPVELVLYGNHLLIAIPAIPMSATHVEIWYRQQREDELILLRRVALNNLYAWRQYYKPIFDSISADPFNSIWPS